MWQAASRVRSAACLLCPLQPVRSRLAHPQFSHFSVLSRAAGKLPAVNWLPDPSVFGSGALAATAGILGTASVMLTAFVCQHLVSSWALQHVPMSETVSSTRFGSLHFGLG